MLKTKKKKKKIQPTVIFSKFTSNRKICEDFEKFLSKLVWREILSLSFSLSDSSFSQFWVVNLGIYGFILWCGRVVRRMCSQQWWALVMFYSQHQFHDRWVLIFLLLFLIQRFSLVYDFEF